MKINSSQTLTLFFLLGGLSACVSARPGRAPSSLGALAKADAQTERFCPGTPAGETCLMTQQSAELYCRERNLRLPTSRDFVAFSMGMGAKGILEMSEVGSTPPPGYYLVASIDPGNRADSFYFNHEGYDAVRGGLGRELLWTSSIVVSHPDFAHVFYGEWGGGGGKPEEHRRTFRNAVRCVQ